MIRLWLGDCNTRLGALSEVRAFVTDPPYGLEFMGKSFDVLKSVWKTFEGLPEDWLEEYNVDQDMPLGDPEPIRLLSFQGDPIKPLNWEEMVQAWFEGEKIPSSIYQETSGQQNWVRRGGFSKPGIGDRDRDWPAFTGGHPVFGNANPTCADCGGRLRGAKKCSCPQPHDHWKPLGPPRTGHLDTRQPDDPNYTRTSVPLFDRAKVRHSSAESYGGSAHLEMQAWHKQWLEKCYAALVPGGVIKVFSATRTFHRLAVAMVEVGFVLVPGESLEAWAYGCLSEDTEVLTPGGWVPYHKATLGTPVLGFDADTEGFTWQPVEETFEYPYDQEAYHIFGDEADHLVSVGHRCLVRRNDEWEFVLSQDLTEEEIVPGLPNRVFPEETDTSSVQPILRKPDAGVSEKTSLRTSGENNSMCSVREEGLETKCVVEEGVQPDVFQKMQRGAPGKRMGDPWAQGGSSSFSPGAGVSYSENDGTKQPRVEGGCDVFPKEGELCQTRADQIHTVPPGVQGNGPERRVCDGAPCVGGPRNGETFNTEGNGSPPEPQPDGQPTGEPSTIFIEHGSQEVRTPRYTPASLARCRARVEVVHYQGVVWCVKVSTGAFVARRNGKVFVTGNSGFPKSLNVYKKLVEMVEGDTEALAQAKKFEGYGTALKPAWEPFLVGRKVAPSEEQTDPHEG